MAPSAYSVAESLVANHLEAIRGPRGMQGEQGPPAMVAPEQIQEALAGRPGIAKDRVNFDVIDDVPVVQNRFNRS